MADPGTKIVVFLGLQASNLGSDFFHPLQELTGKTFVHVLPRHRRHQPRCSLKKIGVRIRHTALLFPGHGMPGQESFRRRLPEHGASACGDLNLCAAYIGDQNLRGKSRAYQFDQIDDCSNRRCQNDDLASTNRINRIAVSNIDCGVVICLLQHRGAVASHDPPAESRRFQSETEGPTNQTCAHNRDLANRHWNQQSTWTTLVLQPRDCCWCEDCAINTGLPVRLSTRSPRVPVCWSWWADEASSAPAQGPADANGSSASRPQSSLAQHDRSSTVPRPGRS